MNTQGSSSTSRRESSSQSSDYPAMSPHDVAAPREQPGILPEGARAPEFRLHSTPDQTVSLAELRGRPVILFFYPADWSPVCGDQATLYNELLPEFQKHRASLVGISVDGVWCHGAFAAARKLRFPLLADFEPKGAVARSYGAYRGKEGVAERALFVLDPAGVVHWSYLSPIGINPGADGILEALESLAPSARRAS
jgi:peroxiredoxin